MSLQGFQLKNIETTDYSILKRVLEFIIKKEHGVKTGIKIMFFFLVKKAISLNRKLIPSMRYNPT